MLKKLWMVLTRFFQDVKKSLETEELHESTRYAMYRYAAWNEGKRLDLMAYAEPRLKSIIEWWKQLMAESEGKDGKGLFPVGLCCTTDLHWYRYDGIFNLFSLDPLPLVFSITKNDSKILRQPS